MIEHSFSRTSVRYSNLMSEIVMRLGHNLCGHQAGRQLLRLRRFSKDQNRREQPRREKPPAEVRARQLIKYRNRFRHVLGSYELSETKSVQTA